MDIVAGAGICKGPNNILGNAYQAIPVGITVEGSNTLTKNLIIFGQGLMKSHPYLYNIVQSIQNDDLNILKKFK
jgi:acyl-CoA dehydrogenase